MLKNTMHALSYYFAILVCAFALLYTLYGSKVHKFLVCEERATGSITAKEECHAAIPGIVPHTYTISVAMPSGYRQELKLKSSFHDYRVGQYVTVVYEDERLLHWYISAEDWRYY